MKTYFELYLCPCFKYLLIVYLDFFLVLVVITLNLFFYLCYLYYELQIIVISIMY